MHRSIATYGNLLELMSASQHHITSHNEAFLRVSVSISSRKSVKAVASWHKQNLQHLPVTSNGNALVLRLLDRWIVTPPFRSSGRLKEGSQRTNGSTIVNTRSDEHFPSLEPLNLFSVFEDTDEENKEQLTRMFDRRTSSLATIRVIRSRHFQGTSLLNSLDNEQLSSSLCSRSPAVKRPFERKTKRSTSKRRLDQCEE